MNEDFTLQQKSGAWYAVVSYKEDGHRKQKWIKTGVKAGSGTKRDAKTAARAAVSEWRAAVVRTAAEKTELSHVLASYIESRRGKIQGSTLAGYAHELERVFRLLPEGIHIQDVTTELIQGSLDIIRARGASENTIRHHVISLRGCFNFAMANNIIAVDPMKDITTPVPERFRGVGFYSPEEARQLLDAVKGTISEIPVTLALFLGLRRSEIAGLQWNDVDLDGNKVTIRQKKVQYTDAKGAFIIDSSSKMKTEASLRILPIPTQLRSVLESVEDRAGAVCKGHNGQPMTPTSISQGFQHAIKKAGLRRIRFHDLRHTCASLLLSAGASMKEVQVILGHSNFSTTADIYSHIDLRGKEAALSKLNDLIKEEEGSNF